MMKSKSNSNAKIKSRSKVKLAEAAANVKKPDPISGKSVGASALTGGGYVVVLNNQANVIINQPKFPKTNVKGLKNINTHLATAQTHANAWVNTYSGEVLNTLQSVISTGELFNNLYSSLLKNAQDMGTQTKFNPNQISALISEIKAIESVVDSQLTKVNSTYADITKYKTNVGSDYSTFTTDYNTAQTALGGTTGEIAKLQKKIDSENDALTKDALMIAGGAVMMVTGILCIVAGVGLEIETAGASTALVVGGIALLAGGAAMDGVAGKNYDDTMKQIAIDQTTLANDQAELTMLTHMKGQFGGLTKSLASSEAALKKLVLAWQELKNNLGAVVTDLQNPEQYLANLKKDDPTATPATVSIIVAAELTTANQDWTSSVKQAKTLLANARGVKYLTSKKSPTQSDIVTTYKKAG